MTQPRRSRRPSPDPGTAPAGGPGPSPAGPAGVQTAEDPEPSLGEVRFDDWFETPVFESDPDERLEELATSRRGPVRLAASTLLRLNARADHRRRRADPDPAPATDPPAPDPTTTASPTTAAEAPDAQAPSRVDAPTARPEPAPDPAAAPEPETAPESAPEPGPVVATPIGAGSISGGTPTTIDSDPGVDAEAEWAALPPVAKEEPETLRRRFNAALDRWAEREAATQTRLERIMLPRRWQS